MAETFSITILWGEDPDLGYGPETFTFDTLAEKLAFIKGMEAAEGYNRYDIIPEGKWFHIGQRVRVIGPIVGAAPRAGEVTAYEGDAQFSVLLDDDETGVFNNTELEAET